MRFIKEVRHIISSTKPNVIIKLNNGVIFYKEYDVIGFDNDVYTDYSFVIDQPQKLDTEYFYLDFTGDTSNRHVSISDYPLTIRNIQKSDFYLINGYKVKASRLLIDWKMPQRLRYRWPVIVSNSGNVIYIPRYNANFHPSPKDNFWVK